MDDVLHQFQIALARKGPPVCQHFVEHHAEREDIGARVERLSLELLRRHVTDSANCQPWPRSELGECASDVALASIGELRQPEVGEFGIAVQATRIFPGLTSRCRMPAP